jgi:putative endonuclease
LNKRASGGNYEQIACNYITEQGAEILNRNFRCKLGEVDIVAKDGKYLCFIEVKYRSDDRFGGPEAAVNIVKQKKICKISLSYMNIFKLPEDTPVRYDVVAIHGEDRALTVSWLKNAFEFCR